MEEKNIAIVYMVAGMSSRFGGKVKQFARVGPDGETLIEYSLGQAIRAGFNKIIFIVGDMTEGPFREMFGDEYKGLPVSYARQEFDSEIRDKPWGTTDAVCSAEEFIDCPFVVCNGDDLYGENNFRMLVEHLRNKGGGATIGYRLWDMLPNDGSVNRGIFDVDEDGNVVGLKEVLGIEKSRLDEIGLSKDDSCSMNVFGLPVEAVGMLKNELDKFKTDHVGDRKAECLLPEEVSRILKGGELEMKVYPAIDMWFGVTRPEDVESVRDELKKLS
jgi:NDP-sugar pyrophosphorylase family protein